MTRATAILAAIAHCRSEYGLPTVEVVDAFALPRKGCWLALVNTGRLDEAFGVEVDENGIVHQSHCPAHRYWAFRQKYAGRATWAETSRL